MVGSVDSTGRIKPPFSSWRTRKNTSWELTCEEIRAVCVQFPAYHQAVHKELICEDIAKALPTALWRELPPRLALPDMNSTTKVLKTKLELDLQST